MNDQQERALDQVLTALDVSESTVQLARALSHRGFAADLHHQRGGTTVAASAVYIALRRAGRPHSLDEVAAAGDVDRTALGRTYKQLIREVDFNLGPTDPHAFVGRFSDQLALDESTVTSAHNLVDTASEAGIRSGHSATGTAAGALYLAGRLTGEDMIQDEVAETTNTSLVALRDRYQEQAMLLGIDRQAWSPPLASTFDAAPLSTEAVNKQLSGFTIIELADDLLASRARCTDCDRPGDYEHLVRNHHTRWFTHSHSHERRCYETTAELTDLLEGFEALDLAARFHNTRVRCTHCGAEGSYTELYDHQTRKSGDEPTCIESS